MKRDTKDELLYPIRLNALEWYYVESHYIYLYHQVPGESRPIQIKIPIKKLRRLLKIK